MVVARDLWQHKLPRPQATPLGLVVYGHKTHIEPNNVYMYYLVVHLNYFY